MEGSEGLDIPLIRLRPLRDRKISKREFSRILVSIKVVGRRQRLEDRQRLLAGQLPHLEVHVGLHVVVHRREALLAQLLLLVGRDRRVGRHELRLRLPAQLGHTARALQENATSRSCPQVSQWARTNP